MSVLQRVQNLVTDGKVDLSITKYNFQDVFHVELTGKDTDLGIDLKVKSADVSLESALNNALDKYYRAIGRGLPNLAAKVIEHRPVDAAEARASAIDLDDDLPF